MRAVVQRVSQASVRVGEEMKSSIAAGILALIGIEEDDTRDDINYMVDKILNLRIFNDSRGIMNLSLLDLNLELLGVSQFTLYGDTRKGRRPSYNRAASPDHARKLFSDLEEIFLQRHQRCRFGEFQAHMDVSLVNDGPVTLLIDSRKEF